MWIQLYCGLLAQTLATPALAAIDLVTLPTREGTQLTIYNSQDITMVRGAPAAQASGLVAGKSLDTAWILGAPR